jgi:hypothetical protein
MFASNVGAYLSEDLSGAPLYGKFLVLPKNIKSILETHARDKHSSLSRKLIENCWKKFYNFGPCINLSFHGGKES